MKCPVCENNCVIPEGSAGKCGLYVNRKGKIVERRPDRYLIISPIIIETMPMLHFHPRGKFLQISTVGCNFDCPGCISTVLVRKMGTGPAWLQKKGPDEIVREAVQKECMGICFLMNDPLASLPTFHGVAKKARERGLLVGCSSNAFFTEDSLTKLLPYLDFINVGLKGSSDLQYRLCGALSAKPVWRNIEKLHKAGVHVEVSCIYRKDQKNDIHRLAGKIAKISTEIPLQVMRFIPVENADPAMEASIREAEETCRSLRKHLHYVYLFNSPGTDHLNTYCHNCGQLIFKRDFYGPMGARLKSSRVMTAGDKISCAMCGTVIPLKSNGIGDREDQFKEAAFQGGYPFTRALEILESIAITIMGTSDKNTIIHVWNEYANRKTLQKLHQDIQDPDTFIALVRSIGDSIHLSEKASRLANHLDSVLEEIRRKSAAIEKRPRVYYAMGKPLFCIKGERMENRLVEIAGGTSVNKELEIDGRPGENITVDQLNGLNPEVIFISAFISSSVDDFCDECKRLGISADAVKNRRVYNHPAPGWDFGSPRWVLGLMYIANVLHPDLFRYDMPSAAESFYTGFYNVHFSPDSINRSFSKPTSNWKPGAAR